MAVLQLEFPPSVAKGEAFLLADWRCSAAEIAERRCAAEKTAPQKEHTSLKARKARDFKDKGVLLWAVGGYADGASEHPNPETL